MNPTADDILAETLAAADPGPETVTALAGLTSVGLSAAGHTDAAVAWHRTLAWATARMYAHAAALAQEAGAEQAGMELSCALHLSAYAADALVTDAAALAGPLAATGAALEAGAISAVHAHAIAEAVEQCDLDPQTTAVVQHKALARAVKVPVADLRRTLTRAIVTADPQAAERRHATAKTHRHVRMYDAGDGMAVYAVQIEAVTAAKLAATVTDHARTLQQQDKQARAEQVRTLDAARADALVDLVAAGSAAFAGNPDPTKATVETTIHITVPMNVLLGLGDGPAELSGHGPVTASQAREAAQAAGAVWRRIITDDLSGAVLDVGRTRYRPAAAIADTVRARHPRCLFPTCSRPSILCDLDHRDVFDRTGEGRGGATAVDNLGPLCRFHHNAKTHTGWDWTVQTTETTKAALPILTVDPSAGDIVWTSPLTGHHYANAGRTALLAR